MAEVWVGRAAAAEEVDVAPESAAAAGVGTGTKEDKGRGATGWVGGAGLGLEDWAIAYGKVYSSKMT